MTRRAAGTSRIIGDETLKLEELIGDLLELARLEGGGGTLAFKDVAISDLFGRVVDRHGPTIRERDITIERRIEPADLEVRGDPQRLEQALQNLASNALRHTPEGGTIRLSASATADGVHIQVADSGAGIPPEHLPRVFDRFYKADPSRSVGVASSGSGLGLSIVQAIVERHGGRISGVPTRTGGWRDLRNRAARHSRAKVRRDSEWRGDPGSVVRDPETSTLVRRFLIPDPRSRLDRYCVRLTFSVSVCPRLMRTLAVYGR